jgi:hypothetical protein
MGGAPVELGGRGRHAAHELLDHDYTVNLQTQLWWTVTPEQGCPLWDAWGHAAEQFLLRAADDLAMAQAALRQMRRAVVAQFFDACWIMVPAAT